MSRVLQPLWSGVVYTLAAIGVLVPFAQLSVGDVAGLAAVAWSGLSVLFLATALEDTPRLLVRLVQARTGLAREYLALHLAISWVPLAWLLVFYPHTPTWTGTVWEPAVAWPLILGLGVLAATSLARLAIDRQWSRDAQAPRAPRTTAPASASAWIPQADVAPVGIQLGLLPDYLGDRLATDLHAALWHIPAGVRVRVAVITDRPYVFEGSTTLVRIAGSVMLGDWWIDGASVVTGLEILSDDRSAAACARDRIPPLLLSRLSQMVSQSVAEGDRDHRDGTTGTAPVSAGDIGQDTPETSRQDRSGDSTAPAPDSDRGRPSGRGRRPRTPVEGPRGNPHKSPSRSWNVRGPDLRSPRNQPHLITLDHER